MWGGRKPHLSGWCAMQMEWSRHILTARALPLPAQSGAQQSGGDLQEIQKIKMENKKKKYYVQGGPVGLTHSQIIPNVL